MALIGKIAVILFGVLSIQWLNHAEALSIGPEIIEAAKKEGTVMLYTSMNVPDVRKVFRGFRKKYPFIDPKVYRSRSASLLQRVINEAQAGRNSMDVLQANAFTVYVLTTKGHTSKYLPPEAKFYPKELRDARGHWVAAYMQVNVIGYNTALVSQSDAPQSYEDLLNPKWTGKIGLDNKQYIWFDGMLKAMGREKGLSFMKKLAGQQIHFRSGNTLLANLLAAGEFAVLANTRVGTLEKLKKKGAPLAWVAAKPTTVNLLPVAVARKAPHPNAAKLFMDYVLSEVGQKVISSLDRTPSRPGIPPSYKRPEGLEFIVNDPAMAENLDQVVTMYKKVFGLP